MDVQIGNTLARLENLTKKERAAFQQALEHHINWMIGHQFEQLVQTLYQLDVEEHKLKALLKENNETDAVTIIAQLIIERQLQKTDLKKAQNRDANISEEDGW